MRGVRILVLGNGAAGAEKQAISLGCRLRSHLQRAGAIAAGDADADSGIQIVRVPLQEGAGFQKLPPALQLIGARLTRDPFFGYATTNEQKSVLCGSRDEHHMRKRVVIGCGRATVALCAALRQPWANTSSEAVYNIQIQHPRVPLHLFDAVVTPRHDLPGKLPSQLASNLYLTHGTVCSVDQESLRKEGEKWQTALHAYTRAKNVRVAWLIGGPCRGFVFSERDALEMVEQVLHLVKLYRPTASLLVTFSRRTPLKVQVLIQNRLRDELRSDDELFLWDGQGPNPFEAMLYHATAIVTTPDSISMTTEAIATGKPVLTVCADRIIGKFQHFHESLFRQKFSAPLSLDAGKLPMDGASPTPSLGQQTIETELDQIAATLTTQILQNH